LLRDQEVRENVEHNYERQQELNEMDLALGVMARELEILKLNEWLRFMLPDLHPMHKRVDVGMARKATELAMNVSQDRN
jgi:hypothetical protein